MASKHNAKLLKDFTAVTIDGLKELAAKGQQLTTESLFEILSKKPEAKAILSGSDNDQPGSLNYDLKEELDRLTKQKSKLITELNAIEEKTSENETSYRRMMLFFAGFMEKTADEDLDDQLKNFKRVLKKQAAIEVVDKVFAELKNASFQTEVEGYEKAGQKGKSLLAGLLKGRSVADLENKYTDQFRETYQEIIDTLGLDLGEKFLSRLLEIGKRIKTSSSIDDFQSLRADVLALLHDYIGRVATEREAVADFVKDLGSRLIAFEKILISAFENTEAMYSSSNEFTVILEGELENITEILQSSKTIEELKNAVNSKLDIMKITVTEKNKRDEAIRQKMDHDIELMQHNFDRMKSEAVEAKKKAEILEKEVLTDPLTGAQNRRSYDKRIREEFQRFTRYKRIFSMLIFDIDYFKSINDTYGHAIGDKCLQVIIQRAQPLLRDTDLLARYGGEEFVVVLPETDRAGAADVAEKLRTTVEKIEFLHCNEVVKITISVGVSAILESDKTPAEIFGRVDMAVYEAKNAGRNKVVEK